MTLLPSSFHSLFLPAQKYANKILEPKRRVFQFSPSFFILSLDLVPGYRQLLDGELPQSNGLNVSSHSMSSPSSSFFQTPFLWFGTTPPTLRSALFSSLICPFGEVTQFSPGVISFSLSLCRSPLPLLISSFLIPSGTHNMPSYSL